MKSQCATWRAVWTITICSVFLIAATIEARTFTATDGRTIEATVLEVSADAAVLKRAGGQSVTVPLKLLVEKDRTYLTAWAKEAQKNRVPRVKVVVDSNKRDKVVQSGYDERRGTIQFKISITNEERDFKIEKATGTLIVLGEDLYDHIGLVMQKKEFKDINIEFGRTYEVNAPELRYEYDRQGYTYGEKYESYIFLLKTSGGKIIDVSGSTSRFENLADIILKLKEGDRFNKQYQKVKSTRSSRSTIRSF